MDAKGIEGPKTVQQQAQSPTVAYPKGRLFMIEYIDTRCNKIEAEVEFTKRNPGVARDIAVANGLTNKGFWYQAGVITKDRSIVMGYAIFDNKGNLIRYVEVDFNKNVDLHHKFYFRLGINNGIVSAYATDLNNGAEASAHFQGVGEYFVGSKGNNENNYSTSIFREIHLPENASTTTISPQRITLISPQIDHARIVIKKSVLSSLSYGSRPVWMSASHTHLPNYFATGDVKLYNNVFEYSEPFVGQQPQSIYNLQITASKTMFLTRGIAAR
jgi:hypothetical protein